MARIDSRAVWRLESDPSFTKDVVERDLLRSPFTLLDIGSRGGIAAHWGVFGGALRELAVEPDPDEPGESAVLAAEGGQAAFLHRPFPATDGLYRMDELYTGTVIEPIPGAAALRLPEPRRDDRPARRERRRADPDRRCPLRHDEDAYRREGSEAGVHL